MIGFNYRRVPAIALAKQLIEEGKLGAHVIDLARFLVGEIEEVFCDQRNFITDRPKPILEDGLFAVAGGEIGTVDVDDASIMLAHFEGKKAMGYFEFTRYAAGHRNKNCIEINGSKGSIIFNMEKMNELELYSCEDSANTQGFKRIQVEEGNQVKPDFRDGLMCQLVLDAAERSFKEKTWVKVKTL